MFEKILGKDKEQQQINDSENKERNFVRERDLLNASTQSDMEYMQMQESRSDLLKWQQDLEDELEKLKHRLKSEVKTEEGWIPKIITIRTAEGDVQTYAPALANDLFVDYVGSQVEPFLSRNILNSNFNEKRILEILKHTMNDIADAMSDSWDLYGIEFINYDLVCRLIKNTIIPAPFRALNDGERRHQRTISKRIEAFQEGSNQTPPKRGLMGVFNNA